MQTTAHVHPAFSFSNPTQSDLFLLKHPFYQAWVEGKLSRTTLQDYAQQYYHHVEAFPRYLSVAIESCADLKARQVLAENLAEEDGSTYGTSHPELWIRFAEGVGVKRSDAISAIPREAIKNVVNTFMAESKASLPCALGALYAYEAQVPEVAGSKIEGLKQHYGICDERTLSFFEVHRSADVEHRASLLQLIEALPETQKGQAQQAADRASQALWDFLSEIHQGCTSA